MAKRKENLSKHTFFLFKGDFDKLTEFYPDVPASVAIRVIIRKHLQMLEQRVAESVGDLDVDIGD